MQAIAIILVLATAQAAKFPKNWTACKKSDPDINKCLVGAINGAIPDLAAGIPSLGIFPLDPLHFNSIAIDQGAGPVSIKLDFLEVDVIGLTNLEVKKVTTDWKDMEIDFEIPGTVILEGNYKINGKVLVLPINGEGKCKLTLDFFTGFAKLKYKENEVGGKKHYVLETLDFSFETKHMHMNFENLFNGDKALGDNMNVFLNENWKEIMHELKPAISAAFGQAFKQIGNRLFSKIDMDSISPP